jgi:hypothetical protein
MDNGGGKDGGDKGVNGLLRRRIEQDQNINIGGRTRLNQRAECPPTGQCILNVSSVELVEKLTQYMG